MKPTIFFVFLIFLSFKTIGQNQNEILRKLKGQWIFPIHNIIEIDSTSRDCGGVPIISNSLGLWADDPQDVKVICSGTVSATVNLGDEYIVIIHSNNYFICYNGLATPKVKKGDIVERDSIIGKLIKQISEHTYFLHLMLFSKDAKELDIKPLFKWSSFPSSCSNSEIQEPNKFAQ